LLPICTKCKSAFVFPHFPKHHTIIALSENPSKLDSSSSDNFHINLDEHETPL
jgi:hypothetical protein